MKKIKKKKLKIAIVVSKFNGIITQRLLNGALKELTGKGIKQTDIDVTECPGAFEIPAAAKKICDSGKYDAVICLGAVIKGETAHFEFISFAAAYGIMNLSMKYKIPVVFGVLTCYNVEQAKARSRDDENNKGAEAARAALEMLNIY